ncbi:MAG: hypothetical protein IH571_02335, partial [Acholeplasmataceae bacterium]|nr:hypothetical protein [Acholeplasmataceae bacterium]
MKRIMSVLLLVLFGVMGLPSLQANTKSVFYSEEDYHRLHAVIQHVENVLKYGHEYNEDTTLIPDAINTLTGEPAKWVFPNRAAVPYSNLANQQNFFRTLVALSKVTNNDKYKNEATTILSDFIDDYQSPNGLFYWGGHRAINLDTLEVQSTEGPNGPHELKNMMP